MRRHELHYVWVCRRFTSARILNNTYELTLIEHIGQLG